MIAAGGPRGGATRLLVVDGDGVIVHRRARDLPALLRPGDVVVANDAATLPASLTGTHGPTGAAIEIRLAGRRSLVRTRRFVAVAFGDGDHRTPTEHRPLPPALQRGDRLHLGPIGAVVERVLGPPRLIELAFEGALEEVWEAIARHGRPIQYAHVAQPLPIWSTWTRLASVPVAFEPPSAGFVLDWAGVERLRARGATLVTLTHAAGISSTGDAALDAMLPLDEPYRIPAVTAARIDEARAAGRRVIAIGTTVVRALEHAALPHGLAARGGSAASHRDGRDARRSRREEGEYREYSTDEQRRAPGWIARRMQRDFHRGLLVRAGDGVATQRLGPSTRLRVVDAILSGTHEPGTSHYELLRAFQGDDVLSAMARELEAAAYETHEFGDFVWLANAHRAAAARSAVA